MVLIPGVNSNIGIFPASGSVNAVVTNLVQTPAQLYGWYIYNSNASVAYCQIFNAIAANVTLGTTPPILSLGIPASGAANLINSSMGISFTTAISFAFTTTRSGNTGNASSVDYNFFYF